MLSASSVVSLASLLFWIIFCNILAKKILLPILKNYINEIHIEIEDLHDQKEQAERFLMQKKSDITKIDQKIAEIEYNFQQEKTLLEQKFENEERLMVQKFSEVLTYSKKFLIAKEEQKIQKYMLDNFDCNLKHKLQNEANFDLKAFFSKFITKD